MKKYLIALSIVLGCFVFDVFAREPEEPHELLQTIEAQIEKAKVEPDKKQLQETQEKEKAIRKELKEEATKRQIEELYHEANGYLRNKNYFKAIEIYEQLLVLDPQAKEEIEKKIDFCMVNLRILGEERRQELDKKIQIQQRKIAQQIVLEKERKEERKEKEEKERKSLLKKVLIKQHLSLGNEYLTHKNYLGAIEEFEKVISLEPSHRKAIRKLAKAKRLADKRITSDPAKQEIGCTRLIKEGFQQAMSYLDSNEYRNANEEFIKILDNINKLNLESAQLKRVRQIKEGAQRVPSEVLVLIRGDKYDEAKKKLWELIQKTSVLAKEKEEKQSEERSRLLIESYFKNTSEYLGKNEYENAKRELQKIINIEPTNSEANALLEKLEDIIEVMKEVK